ncbi:MAG TPA: DUF1289 domain-containing protein [Verrucomicrobiae bacterium]|jgi:hypothetical protein
MTAPSPCINICQLDERDVCLGCFRTRDEIARWMHMSDLEKSSVIAALKNRRLTEQVSARSHLMSGRKIFPANSNE